MTMPSTSSASAADEPPPYHESMNVKEHYVRWAEQQPHQNDLSFCCDPALGFFNNPATLLLQSDVLTYMALDAHCLLLLFLAFGCYDFVPEEYNAPGLFPHDLLDAPEIDHLPETLIAAFHNIP
uniref:Uncharacterized protein n=1 Tax=Romanomermis culicivorax TaxID=13658 RepID=A0A915JEY6_ROMCU